MECSFRIGSTGLMNQRDEKESALEAAGLIAASSAAVGEKRRIGRMSDDK